MSEESFPSLLCLLLVWGLGRTELGTCSWVDLTGPHGWFSVLSLKQTQICGVLWDSSNVRFVLEISEVRGMAHYQNLSVLMIFDL